MNFIYRFSKDNFSDDRKISITTRRASSKQVKSKRVKCFVTRCTHLFSYKSCVLFINITQ